MNKQLKIIVTITIISLLMLPVHSFAQPCGGYEVTAIIQTDECPPLGFPGMVPLGLNEQGWMVGSFRACIFGPNIAWLWTPDGGLVVIPTPAGTSDSRAMAISGSLIVGEYANSELELGIVGFLYNFETDEFTSLGSLNGADRSSAHAINSNEEIVGFWGNTIKGPSPLAFIWRDGKMIDINPDFGTLRSQANDINTNSLVTGWMGSSISIDARAFIWNDGKVTELPQMPGAFTSKGNQINTNSQIAISGIFNEDHPLGFISGGFLWEAGNWTDLGMLEGYDSMAVNGLNDAGTIVGWLRDIQNGQHPDTAFVWSDGEMVELHGLLPPESQLQIKRAVAINEIGQIAVQADDADNDIVAVLLSPIKGPLGDLDANCRVNTVDLLLLFSNWGLCDSCASCPADLNQDCIVSVIDLLILFANWG